jgi:hypothetical protein
MLRSLREDITEELDTLENSLKRLRIEYEQYFMGNMKRPPSVLQGKVQKTVLKLAASPPLNTRLRFRFNQLNSRFQMFRQQWGRTMRQIEAGTYSRHRFKADLREREQGERQEGPTEESAEQKKTRRKRTRSGDPLDQLADALNNARRKTGQHGDGVDRQKLSRSVRQQTAALKEKYGDDARIKFKVVIENDEAKLKASVSKG